MWQGLPYLWSSLWGRFGYGQLPLPQMVYQVTFYLCALALVGYLIPRRGPLPWTGLARPVAHYRLLRRGDFVEFWRKRGTGHSAVFWGRDRDETGRERMWYWSSQPKPRYAYPLKPGGEPVTTPGYGLNWEYIGDEIDPTRIYGVTLLDQPSKP